MTDLWQLKKLSTGEALSEPQPLPENWGPIFGLHGFIDKLGDLGAWLGDGYADMGWVVVGTMSDPEPKLRLKVSKKVRLTPTKKELVLNRVKELLRESDWSMLTDVYMTREQKIKWIEYRRALRDVKLQPGFPEDIYWPVMPE